MPVTAISPLVLLLGCAGRNLGLRLILSRLPGRVLAAVGGPSVHAL